MASSPRYLRLLSLALGLAGLGLAAGGCYNPSLGDMPFQCATTGKRCPDDYSCVKQGQYEVCVPGGEVKPDLGADQFKPFDGKLPWSKDGQIYIDGATVKPSPGCSDESSEPNNSGATATTLPGQGTIPGWEICYPGDVDSYAVNVNSGQKLIVEIKFSNSKGDLDMALINPQGFVIRDARSEDSNERIDLTITEAGRYVIAVWGYDDAVNTYDIDLQIL